MRCRRFVGGARGEADFAGVGTGSRFSMSRAETSMTASLNAAARLSVLRSSRTLPGQSCASRRAMASGVERLAGRARRRARRENARPEAAMSPGVRAARAGATRNPPGDGRGRGGSGRGWHRARRSRRVSATTRTSTAISPCAAHPAQAAGFEHAQQLGLQVERQLANLVEHQGAARGFLEPARLARAGAGEGAALVSEELALGQLARERAAVHGHEGARRDRAQCRARPGEELLASAAFPGDQDWQACSRHARGLVEELGEGQGPDRRWLAGPGLAVPRGRDWRRLVCRACQGFSDLGCESCLARFTFLCDASNRHGSARNAAKRTSARASKGPGLHVRHPERLSLATRPVVVIMRQRRRHDSCLNP